MRELLFVLHVGLFLQKTLRAGHNRLVMEVDVPCGSLVEYEDVLSSDEEQPVEIKNGFFGLEPEDQHLLEKIYKEVDRTSTEESDHANDREQHVNNCEPTQATANEAQPECVKEAIHPTENARECESQAAASETHHECVKEAIHSTEDARESETNTQATAWETQPECVKEAIHPTENAGDSHPEPVANAYEILAPGKRKKYAVEFKDLSLEFKAFFKRMIAFFTQPINIQRCSTQVGSRTMEKAMERLRCKYCLLFLCLSTILNLKGTSCLHILAGKTKPLFRNTNVQL